MNYIVIWKDGPGQQVSTVVDSNNEPMQRDQEWLNSNNIPEAQDKDTVFSILADADGTKFAVTPDLARATLGWDL